MLRYLCFALIKVLGVAIALGGLNLILPLFGDIKKGWVNNGEREDFEEFLPDWLFWFSTNYDNSLWGDEAHRIRHENYTGYFAQVCWLYRNPFKGADWTILGAPVTNDEFVIKFSDSRYEMESYFQHILPNGWVFGWLLDAYYHRVNDEPKASFVFGK